MSDGRESSEEIAIAVADGGRVDWDEALRTASGDEERRVLRQLRLVESVVQILGGAGGAGGEGADPSAPDPALAGRVWGPLELRRRLGEGSFATVYLAWDPRLEREVALKIHERESAAVPGASRILHEGRLLAKLRHPHVVAVYGADVHDDRVGLWMERVRGHTLEQLLEERGPFGAREAALIGIDLCGALAAVHRAGIVHRDVKAQNVMREEGGRILLMDLGSSIEADAVVLEQQGISGTPFYLAPELLRGAPPSARSDLYGLGVLLYRLASGSFPIEAASWRELRERMARRERTLLRDRRPDLPEAFVSAVERSLAWEPADRFASAGEMEQALVQALGTGTPLATAEGGGARADGVRRASWVGIGVLVAAAALAFVLLRPSFRGSGNPVAGDAGRPAAGVAGSAQVQPPATAPGDAARGEDLRTPGASARDAGPRVPPAAGAVNSAPAPATTNPATSAIPAASAPYTVEAALYRTAPGSTVRERLDAGARLALGDRLTLEFQASRPLHVYVIDEDDAGRSYVLFPLPGLDAQNPLAPDARHVLPGRRDGRSLSWTVDSRGGREHMMVLASPDRLTEFEAEMASLARAGQVAVSIPETAKARLRGLGGLAESPAAPATGGAGRLFEMAQRLAAGSEVVKGGVWMRQIVFENPGP